MSIRGERILDLALGLSAGLLLLFCGCGRSGGDGRVNAATTPKDAAAQLESAFSSAPAEVKQNALVASEAMRRGDFEKAVVSLQTVRSATQVSKEQGLAVQNSMIAMEARLVSAMDGGDENAKRAYELLKRLKRR